MTKPKIALIRGQFLNQFDIQSYTPLLKTYDITLFGSQLPIHRDFSLPVEFLASPTDLPDFPKKMSILNRLFIDANYLVGLEGRLKGFDIAHTAETYYHFTRQALLAKRKGYVKKVICTVWENIPFNNEGILGRKLFKKQAREHIDHFIAVTEEAKKALLQEGIESGKISVIGPGIDTRKFFPEKDHFEKLGKKRKDITILFVGRLELYKGVMDILRAAVLLKKDKDVARYTLHYLFVGKGSQKETMLYFAKENNLEKNILFMTADYSSIPEVYTMADIFIAPSKKNKHWQEQYGMMLLEAQAAGLPIITTKNNSITENVGNASICIDEGNIKDISKALKDFILSPHMRVTYGKKARARAEKVHDIHIVASKIDTIYKMALNT